jgi:VWFA-related protein
MSKNLNIRNAIILGSLWLASGAAIPAISVSVCAQDQKKAQDAQKLERKLGEQPSDEPEDVIRVRTDLVQTTVTVTDKRGAFIDNLRAEDFELRIDGKPSSVLFFDRVVNGKPLASNAGRSVSARAMSAADTSRTVFFFVDDLHLSAESILRTRKMLSNYIEKQMGETDQVVIVSATGQLGFLEQLSSEKEVLRTAVDRLRFRAREIVDLERPRMSIFQAQAIEQNNPEVKGYFESILLKDQLAAQMRTNPASAQLAAETQVRARADRLVRDSDNSAMQTLRGLSSAVRSSSGIPGRKLFVFVSDGFLVNNQNTFIRDRLQQITDAAVRGGAVVYTIQASGLNTSFPDASSDVIMVQGTDTGRVYGEDVAVQDPLTELAADTGGKAILNANDLNPGVQRALKESNDYYLLAWRPETPENGSKGFHRIEVAVKGRPELSVLLQRGFFSGEPPVAPAPAKTQKPKTPETTLVDDLAEAIKGRVQKGSLQTHLLAHYLDVANHGARLSVLVKVEGANESKQNGKAGTIDVAGVVYDDSGKVVGSFLENLRPEANTEGQVQNATYFNQFDVKPGLYQVRIAARDSKGLTSMSTQWLTIPDLTARHLTLSSLLIGERDINGSNTKETDSQIQKALLKIDKRFTQNSRMRVLTYIYNAASDPSNQSPRLNARIDLFSGNNLVVSTPALVVDTSDITDPARIPYAGELNLASLVRGNYRIRVTVIDLAAKAYASQEASFEVE